MDDCLNQSRTMLNLLLVGMLVLSWAVFHEQPSVFELARTAVLNASMYSTKNTMERGGGRDPLPEIAEFTQRLRNDVNVVYRHEFPLLSDDALAPVHLSVFEPLLNVKRRPAQSVDYGEEAAVDHVTQTASSLFQLAKDLGVGTFATLGDLTERSRRTVTLPIVNETVQVDVAQGVISLGLLGPLLVFVSLTAAIYAEVRRGRSDPPMSFLPFNPGILGQSITYVWLLSPAAIAWYGALAITHSAILRYAALALTFVGLFAVVRLLAIRYAQVGDHSQAPAVARVARGCGFTWPGRYWSAACVLAVVSGVASGDVSLGHGAMLMFVVLMALVGVGVDTLGIYGVLVAAVVLTAFIVGWYIRAKRIR